MPGVFAKLANPSVDRRKAEARLHAVSNEKVCDLPRRGSKQDAFRNEGPARIKLKMPMLVLAGEKASGEFLITQGRFVADNVEGIIIKGSGHWLIDEEPRATINALRSFMGGAKP
jgi:pimeloyl-ACP methyl ester carboxylesterase